MAIETLAEEVVNEVASNLEEAAEATRKLNVSGLGYLAVGLGIGAAAGFYFGYKFNREKIRAEAYREAEVEVAQLREVYLEKTLAKHPVSTVSTEVPTTTGYHGQVNIMKPSIEEIVEEKGYSVKVPERERPLPAPVPILDDLPENPTGSSKSMNAGWNYEQEVLDRTPDFPYVIHQNEYNHSEPHYSKVVYTYYAIDDVVADDEDERPIPHGDIVVGLDNLKFGHGSDDEDVVYVRNDRLETDMQICRVNRSFEEEVLGMTRDDNDN
jgi:hypothetical protein